MSLFKSLILRKKDFVKSGHWVSSIGVSWVLYNNIQSPLITANARGNAIIAPVCRINSLCLELGDRVSFARYNFPLLSFVFFLLSNYGFPFARCRPTLHNWVCAKQPSCWAFKSVMIIR